MFARASKRKSGVAPRDPSSVRPPKEMFSKDKIIFSSERCTAEKVSSFPKELRDILRGSDTSTISGKFEGGYGILIIQNILHIWDVASGMKIHKYTPPLSHKDLNPDLVTLIQLENKIGLAVCSLDGAVRVWPSLDETNIYWDTSLKSQSEPISITYLDPYGVVVGTGGGSEQNLHLVSMNPISCKPFKSGATWLGYIMRSTRPSVCALAAGPRRNNCSELYVLTDQSLQKWEVQSNTERMQQEIPIHSRVKDELMRVDNSEYVVKLHDAKFVNEGILYVLASCYLAYCPIDSDRKITYIIASVRLEGSSMDVIDQFEVPVTKPLIIAAELPKFETSPRLAIPHFYDPTNTAAFICLEHSVVLITGAQQKKDEIELGGDRILALGTSKRAAYVIVEKLGCVKFNLAGQDHSEGRTLSPTRIQQQNQNNQQYQNNQIIQVPTNNKDILSHAIKYHSSGDISKTLQYTSQLGNDLSELVVQTSYSILDHNVLTESDPQWTDASNSMFIRKQIDAKKHKHTLLTDLLKDRQINLWDKISTQAQLVVQENGEKLTAGLNLRTAQTSQTEGDVNRETLIQRAIRRTLSERGREQFNRSAIIAQETFYSQVSTIDEILGPVYEFLLAAKPATSHSNLSSSIAEFREANQIYLAFFSAFSPSTLSTTRVHFKDKRLSIKHLGQKYLQLAREFLRLELGQQERELYQQIYNLTKPVLATYRHEVEHLLHEQIKLDYFKVREELLLSFMTPAYKEMAQRLAEEFLDFRTLLIICEETKEREKVYEYMRQFNKEGFPAFVFEFYYKSNRFGELMEIPNEFNSQLMNFLRPYPSLAWVQFLRCQNYSDASVALQQANEQEDKSIGRKKVLLSLAKLCNLANSGQPDKRLEQQMYLLRLQKTILPEELEPLEPKLLIECILMKSTSVLHNVLSALEVVKHSDTLLPGEVRKQLAERTWYFSLERGFNWNSMIPAAKNGLESVLSEAIETSATYNAAIHNTAKGMLPKDSLNTVFSHFRERMIQSRPTDDPDTLSRLLQTIYNSIVPLPACSA